MIRENLYKAITITKMLNNQNVYTESSRISELLTDKRFELEKITNLLELEGKWSREEIILLVNNIPTSDDLADEASTFGSIIVNTGYFPLAEIWTSEAFSEELDMLKASMIEGGNMRMKDGCRFSFTDDIVIKLSDIPRMLSYNLNCLSRTDLNNIFSLTSLLEIEEISYPEHYEELIIANLKETNYFMYDCTGADRYRDFFKDHKLQKIIEYICNYNTK